MCRPFWLRQSWWHAELLLIKSQEWQSSFRPHPPPPGRSDFLASNRADGMQEERKGEHQGEKERRERERGREETRRRVSLGSRAGLFNEPAHSTPPSSVAPAGWRPPGSGSAVGGPVPSLLSRGWRFTLSGCLWSNQLTHKDTCMDSKWPKKHPFKISLTNKHRALGWERFIACTGSLFSSPPVTGIIDSAWHVNMVVITPTSPWCWAAEHAAVRGDGKKSPAACAGQLASPGSRRGSEVTEPIKKMLLPGF